MTLLALLLAQAALPAPAPVAPKAQSTAEGAAVFARACTACHGADGRAKTAFAKDYKIPDFTTEAWQKGITDEQIVRVITDGNREKGMIPFGDRLSKDEIASLVPYLRALGRPQK